MDILDHHPDFDTRSTGTAPLLEKFLDALASKASYTYDADIAIDFHNVLTSSLITYLVRLDYVDRALRKSKGKTASGIIKPLFDGLAVAIQAVFVISHSKAMAAHMNMLSNSLKTMMHVIPCPFSRI